MLSPPESRGFTFLEVGVVLASVALEIFSDLVVTLATVMAVFLIVWTNLVMVPIILAITNLSTNAILARVMATFVFPLMVVESLTRFAIFPRALGLSDRNLESVIDLGLSTADASLSELK